MGMLIIVIIILLCYSRYEFERFIGTIFIRALLQCSFCHDAYGIQKAKTRSRNILIYV